ncbi:MAG: PIG-L family deacetylase, partial [Bacteroidota bacterium]
MQRLLGVVLSVGIAAVNSVSQSPRTVDAAELQLAMKRLTVVGSALYVAAHPDDENTALLSYLAKGRLVRAAYLSVTRGEGGQNLIGSEQGELLGIVRTQELLAARRYDGAEQFFTRAIDFGYSKSSEETIRIWDHEKILSDMVWIIRSFRPDVMITRFAPTLGGHGNHTASAIIAEAAFQAAGDPAKFPEQLKFVQPWQPKRVVFNAARFLTEQFDTSKAVTVDVGEYNPLLGKSYSEIAGISRSMHKSQGFGAGQNRGPQVNYFIHRVEEQAKADLFDSVDLTWSRVPGGKKVGALLEEASRTFQPHNPSASIHLLLQAYSEMAKLPADAWVTYKRSELLEVVKSCAGLWVDALASDYSAAPGTQVRVTASFIQRSNVSVTLERVGFPFSQSDTVLNRPLVNNVPMQIPSSISLPKEMQYTQPYWLQEKGSLGSYQVPEQRLVGLPENPAPLSINVAMLFDNVRVVFDVPIRYRWVDPVEGELYRPFEIVPPVAINLQERVYLFHNPDEKRVTVTLRSGGTNMRGEVRLIPPEGWSSRPSSIPFTLQRKGEELNVSFTVGVGSSTTNGSFR